MKKENIALIVVYTIFCALIIASMWQSRKRERILVQIAEVELENVKLINQQLKSPINPENDGES